METTGIKVSEKEKEMVRGIPFQFHGAPIFVRSPLSASLFWKSFKETEKRVSGSRMVFRVDYKLILRADI